MLKLTRKRGESIQVGEIVVTVTRLSASRAILGIEAPDDVKILRGELVDRDHTDVPTNPSNVDSGPRAD